MLQMMSMLQMDHVLSDNKFVHLEVFKLKDEYFSGLEKNENMPNSFFVNPQVLPENFLILRPTTYHGCEMFSV